MRLVLQENGPKSVLGRALLILGCFTAEDGELSLREIASRTNIPRATIYRLVKELADLKILECSDTGVQLGLRLFELGQLVSRQRSLRQAALPYMQGLSEATRETVHLAILEQSEILYVEKLSGRSGPKLPSRIGGRMPTYCTGLGKAMLAFSDSNLVREVVESGMKRITPHTVTSPPMLYRQLVRTRESGIAFEYEESTKGALCVASPLLGDDGKAFAAISISGWVTRLDASKLAPTVKTTAINLTRALRAADRQSAPDGGT